VLPVIERSVRTDRSWIIETGLPRRGRICGGWRGSLLGQLASRTIVRWRCRVGCQSSCPRLPWPIGVAAGGLGLRRHPPQEGRVPDQSGVQTKIEIGVDQIPCCLRRGLCRAGRVMDAGLRQSQRSARRPVRARDVVCRRHPVETPPCGRPWNRALRPKSTSACRGGRPKTVASRFAKNTGRSRSRIS